MKLLRPLTTGTRHTFSVMNRLAKYYALGKIDPKGPTTLRIEITNHCNFDCLMCDHGSLKRAKVLMKWDLFQRIVDDAVASKICILGLNRFGEPTLHPKLPEMAAYAKEQGIPIVSFTTNASMLTEDLCRRLLETRSIDVIACSLDGNTKETYEKIRKGKTAIFERVVENIERLVSMRNSLGMKTPEIQINTVIMNENVHEFSSLVHRWQKVVDNITPLAVHEFGPISNVAAKGFRNGAARGTGKCPYLAYMLVSYADGTAGVCCGDSEGVIKVGNFATQTIHEIWNGAEMQKVRQIHAERRFGELPVCANCDLTFPPSHHIKGYVRATLLRQFN